jgi:hypothetical protein
LKKIILLLAGFFIINTIFAQNNSDSDRDCHLQISLLTCTPGAELYSTFGHSALRVKDSLRGTDIIFNYGTFDFNDPNFYSKFTRGKLLYFVSVEELSDFLNEYTADQRGVTEQVLDLSCAEKEKLFTSLQENAKEENKYYKYDFVHDNCTTRLRDIVFKIVTGSIATKDIRSEEKTSFRKLLHEYLDKGHQYWSKLGIDILMGRSVDNKISNNDAMFLPDYLMKAFDSTTVNGQPLVSGKKMILRPALEFKKNIFLSPLFIFIFLFLVVAVLSFNKKANRFFSFFDPLLFFLCGATGVLILFMWVGTDHQVCRNNFNILWALPTHLLFVFYFGLTSVLLLLFIIGALPIGQQINSSVFAIIALLFLRSVIRYKKMDHA